VKPKETSQTPGDQVQLGTDRPEIPVGQHKKWLFMNFIAADCNLKEFQADNIDNQELVGSDANTHIVAMIDVGPEVKAEGAIEERPDVEGTEVSEGDKASGKPSIIDWKGCRTYYVTQDSTPKKLNSPVVEEQGMDVNMSKPETLTKFIVDTMAKFPSDHVALVLNDHGAGFLGALADDTQGGFMSTPQIRQALADAEKITGKRIDILGFDACLMAQTEVAHEFKDVAHYLLASEETEGGPGWTYSGMLKDTPKGTPSDNQALMDAIKNVLAQKRKTDGALQSNKAMPDSIKMLQNAMTKKIDVSPEEFCKIVVKVNEEHCKDIPTFSATDLTKVDDVTKASDELGKAILNTDNKTAVKDAIMKAENYGGWQQPKPYADMRDLHHIASLLEGIDDPKLKEAAKKVKKAIGEAVVANETDKSQYPNSKGLSVYAPTDKPGGLGNKYEDLQFAKDTSWNEAMASLGNVPASNPKGDADATGGMGLDQLMNMSEEQLLELLAQLSGGSEEIFNPDGTPRKWPDGSPWKSVS